MEFIPARWRHTWPKCFIQIRSLLPACLLSSTALLAKYSCTYVRTHTCTHTHRLCEGRVCVCVCWGECGGAGFIGKGVLACCKGNHCAGAWGARVQVSAHTVWMRSSFPPGRKLRRYHTLPPPRSLPMHRRRPRHRSCRSSSAMTHCNWQGGRRCPGVRSLGWLSKPAAPCTSQGAAGLSWRNLWWPVEEGAEEGWCRHIGGTDTAAGTAAGTVGTDSSAGNILSRTCRYNSKRTHQFEARKLAKFNTGCKSCNFFPPIFFFCSIQKDRHKAVNTAQEMFHLRR